MIIDLWTIRDNHGPSSAIIFINFNNPKQFISITNNHLHKRSFSSLISDDFAEELYGIFISLGVAPFLQQNPRSFGVSGLELGRRREKRRRAVVGQIVTVKTNRQSQRRNDHQD